STTRRPQATSCSARTPPVSGTRCTTSTRTDTPTCGACRSSGPRSSSRDEPVPVPRAQEGGGQSGPLHQPRRTTLARVPTSNAHISADAPTTIWPLTLTCQDYPYVQVHHPSIDRHDSAASRNLVPCLCPPEHGSG